MITEFNPQPLYDKHEHVMGGCWGNKIAYFKDGSIPTDHDNGTIQFYGWLPPSNRVKPGQKIVCEYQKSWIVYEFTEIDKQRDPPDMFFAKARLFEAYDKETSEKIFEREQ